MAVAKCLSNDNETMDDETRPVTAQVADAISALAPGDSFAASSAVRKGENGLSSKSPEELRDDPSHPVARDMLTNDGRMSGVLWLQNALLSPAAALSCEASRDSESSGCEADIDGDLAVRRGDTSDVRPGTTSLAGTVGTDSSHASVKMTDRSRRVSWSSEVPGPTSEMAVADGQFQRWSSVPAAAQLLMDRHAGDLAEESSSRKERRLLRRFRFTSNFQFFRKAGDADRVAAETRVRSRLWRWRRAASKGKAKRVIRAGESYGMGL